MELNCATFIRTGEYEISKFGEREKVITINHFDNGFAETMEWTTVILCGFTYCTILYLLLPLTLVEFMFLKVIEQKGQIEQAYTGNITSEHASARLNLNLLTPFYALLIVFGAIIIFTVTTTCIKKYLVAKKIGRRIQCLTSCLVILFWILGIVSSMIICAWWSEAILYTYGQKTYLCTKGVYVGMCASYLLLVFWIICCITIAVTVCFMETILGRLERSESREQLIIPKEHLVDELTAEFGISEDSTGEGRVNVLAIEDLTRNIVEAKQIDASPAFSPRLEDRQDDTNNLRHNYITNPFDNTQPTQPRESISLDEFPLYYTHNATIGLNDYSIIMTRRIPDSDRHHFHTRHVTENDELEITFKPTDSNLSHIGIERYMVPVSDISNSECPFSFKIPAEFQRRHRVVMKCIINVKEHEVASSRFSINFDEARTHNLKSSSTTCCSNNCNCIVVIYKRSGSTHAIGQNINGQTHIRQGDVHVKG